MNFEDVEKLVVKWGVDRGIYSQSNVRSQIIKLNEEFFELAWAETRPEIEDALGDMLVVMTHIAKMMDTTLTFCFHTAYDEIKDRKGKMVNGIFVKEEK